MTNQQKQLIRQIFQSELDYMDSKINREDLEKEERDERIIEQWVALLPDVDFASSEVKTIRDDVIAELIEIEENELIKLEGLDIEELLKDAPEDSLEECRLNTLEDIEKNKNKRLIRIGILESIREESMWLL